MLLTWSVLFALGVDRCCGEPPPRLHPVVWIGNYLRWAGQRVQRIVRCGVNTDYPAFWLAALYWCAGAAIVVVASWGLQELILTLPLWLALPLLGLALKPLLAWAMLKSEVLAVAAALDQSLDAGLERLSWLVSRDTGNLSATQVRESAIESLAENLSDSVVAPIFWFVLLGLPGAALYRFANTADAMWGYPGVYQGHNWQWAGKWAARADDGLNWLPARLTGLLLALLHRVPLRLLSGQAGLTPSPNSGWPMAAMALALNLRLGKHGVYVLHALGDAPRAADVRKAVICAEKVLVALVLSLVIATVLIVVGAP